MLRLILGFIWRVLCGCALLVVTTRILGILQPSTEIAYICPVWQICLTDADRGVIVHLTNDPALSASRLSWSPDGEQLAFRGLVESVPGVYVLDMRTYHYRLLVENGEDPAWSPQGDEIAFIQLNTETRSADLMAATLDGHVRLLHRSPGYARNPSWSPDGTAVVFQEVFQAYAPHTSILYTIGIDDTGLRRLTPIQATYFDPAWSPDGSRIAVHDGHANTIALIYLNIDATMIIDDDYHPDFVSYAYKGSPSWSPDGKRIAYDNNASRGFWQPQGWWVYVMNADASGSYVIGYGQRPAWRPPRILSWDDLMN